MLQCRTILDLAITSESVVVQAEDIPIFAWKLFEAGSEMFAIVCHDLRTNMHHVRSKHECRVFLILHELHAPHIAALLGSEDLHELCTKAGIELISSFFEFLRRIMDGNAGFLLDVDNDAHVWVATEHGFGIVSLTAPR